MSDSVIAALRAALEASPEDAALREHLVRVLLDAGRGPEALPLVRVWLASDPTHQGALALAVRAADLAGDSQAAGQYQLLLNALYQYGQGQDAPPRRQTASADGWNDGSGQPEDEDLTGAPAPSPQAGPGLTDFESRWQPVAGDVTLKDVVGMTALKERLDRSLLGPLRHPQLAAVYGGRRGGGLLLYGPPGCGKTFVARAVAGELGARFLEVTVADVLDMWLGNAERNVQGVFASARRHAPCVLFFDEVDALGRGRHVDRGRSHHVTQVLLRELDGLGERDGVFVLAATNAPWDVDMALRRPGRLGTAVLVPPPDTAARAAMFGSFMAGRPVEGLDAGWLARQTEGFSGADVRAVCEAATERALGEAYRTGRARPVRMADFREALREARPSTAEWLEHARNYVAYANAGGQYDDLAALLRERRRL
ncbi:cell division cycle protein 48 [Deinococcus aetherius]|uniref:Cell division cycle protein 48 n=1 Tax=Deinococcus aetherius TaxID=200252 RepID=A0ABM8AB49_9DEIO|nr:AAA family ATPase [Deinococcus aetherius]BDP40837.1 cell division cycle protein 48 [Deinococcus aetherius]